MVLNSDDLFRFLMANKIDAEIVFLMKETPTVEAAASAVGVSLDQIVKSLLFLADGEASLIIANGTSRVSYAPISRILGLSRRKIKLADAQEVLKYTGYAVGTVPPFGHLSPLPTLISERVMEQSDVYAGGGGENALMRINTGELLRATNAEVVDIYGS